MASITDGTSNTLYFGEAMGGHPQTNEGALHGHQISDSWMGTGPMVTAWGMATSPQQATWFRFSSNHPGVIQFAFADGAVKPVGVTAEHWQFVYATAMSEGRVVDDANLTN